MIKAVWLILGLSFCYGQESRLPFESVSSRTLGGLVFASSQAEITHEGLTLVLQKKSSDGMAAQYLVVNPEQLGFEEKEAVKIILYFYDDMLAVMVIQADSKRLTEITRQSFQHIPSVEKRDTFSVRKRFGQLDIVYFPLRIPADLWLASFDFTDPAVVMDVGAFNVFRRR
jgi:hypothetical protein